MELLEVAMDWRDFMRGFFGHRERSGGDQWPPPPPIPEFKTEGSGEDNSSGFNSGRDRSEDFSWSRQNRRSSRGDEGDGMFENFGNRLVIDNEFVKCFKICGLCTDEPYT